MYKRKALLFLLIGLLVFAAAPLQTPAFASDAANTLAVCGCGKIFTPNEKTEYITVDGKQYACCSHECHEMASKNPAAAAKMAESATSDAIATLAHTDLEVGNVLAVTQQGTKAVCGCGKEFTIGDETEYIQADGKSYACCSHKCHEMASKDPAAAARMAKEQLSKK